MGWVQRPATAMRFSQMVMCGAIALTVSTWGCGGDDDEPKDKGPSVPFTPGEAITATPMQWQYVPVAGTRCRDGLETGIAININPNSDRLVFYFEGGGACFNTFTCGANPRSWGASNVTATFGGGGQVLSRTNASNPFADWNMVYVPYCTGDVFSGTAESSPLNGEPMQGYTNVGKYLERIVPTFPDVTQVVLTGSSAGGFGVAWNWMRTQDAFGDIPVYALDDSGPPFGPDYFPSCLAQQMANVWGWADSVHPACDDCNLSTGDVVQPLMDLGAQRSDPNRFGLVSNTEDSTIKLFFSFGLNNCSNALPGNYPTGQFPMGLAEVREQSAAYDHVKGWIKTGTGHTFLMTSLGDVSEGVVLSDWIEQFVSDDPTWTNVYPPL